MIRNWRLFVIVAACVLGAPSMGKAQGVTTLHTFSGDATEAGVIQASDGKFYGIFSGNSSRNGAIYQITASGTLTTLHTFNGTDGSDSLAGLIQATDGNLYGTTYSGGTYDNGTVFKIALDGTFTSLYSFTGGSDGAGPRGALIQASDGNLYGTTAAIVTLGQGTVFKITTSGVLTTICTFSGPDGAVPQGALIQGADGNFYGTTSNGGAGYGTVFKVTPAGSLTTLHSFDDSDGYIPQTGVVQASDGYLYGTTWNGGSSNLGAVFKVSTTGDFTLLHSFSGADGGEPLAGLVQASDGNLYGSTYNYGGNNQGTLFRITTTGGFTSLYSFSASGGGPNGTLVQAVDGYLYGTTSGTVFRFSGVYPVPVLSGLSPGSRDAGGPGFTLTVKGASFQPFSTIHWNGAPLATSYVSAAALKATIPASLIASPGKASITVVTGAGGGTSNKRAFTILLTTLRLTAAHLTKNNDGSYTAAISLKNIGYLTAPSVQVTNASLGMATTSTTLPVACGDIAAGSTGTVTLTFPVSAGTSGTKVTLKVSGTFTGGKFTGSLKVTLP